MASKPFASGHVLAAADVNDLAGVLDRSTSTVDVVSTVANTNLYSKSIGAGHMSTDRAVRLTILGDYLNNTGGTQTLSFFIRFGATYMFGDLATTAAPATRYPLEVQIMIANLGATNSQRLGGSLYVGAPTAGATSGVGDIDAGMDGSANWAAGSNVFPFYGTAAEDTTVATTLAVSVTHGAANANLSCRKLYALLELL